MFQVITGETLDGAPTDFGASLDDRYGRPWSPVLNPGDSGPSVWLLKSKLAAAAWKGEVILRTRVRGDRAVLEVQDNGIGMSEEVRRRCTETHFSTKRDNALFAGLSAGMGLGLSFVVVILQHHQATLEIASEPLHGARFRVTFPTTH